MQKQIPHSEILNQLLSQVSPVDFESVAFPEKKSILQQILNLQKENKLDDRSERLLASLNEKLKAFKIKERHLIVISVDSVIDLAKSKSWGLCKNNGFVYLYNGAFWKPIDKEAFQAFLGKAAERQGVGEFSAKFYQFRDQLFKQFMTTAHLSIPEANSGNVLMNLLNGTLVITPTGNHIIRDFDSGDFLTYQLPFAFDPDAVNPLFTKYLNQVLPSAELQKILSEYLGGLFVDSSTLKLEKTLLLYGSGANGKSVFFDIVTALLGQDNVSNFSLQNLTDTNGYFRAKMANKLVNYASEINGKLETSVFKQLVSGEPVEARLPYGEPFSLTKYAKLIFNCNELPKEVEHTNAFFRRFIIIPFEVTIPDAEQDKELSKKIVANELSGVINWVLAGLLRLLQQKNFTESEIVSDQVAQFKQQSDPVESFLIEEDYKSSNCESIPLLMLYTDFRRYSIDNGHYPISNKTFASRLRNLGYLIERKTKGNIIFINKETLF